MKRISGQPGFRFTRAKPKHAGDKLTQSERRFMATEQRPLDGLHAAPESACRHPVHGLGAAWQACVACDWCGGDGVFRMPDVVDTGDLEF
jgi:hypothetical protein